LNTNSIIITVNNNRFDKTQISIKAVGEKKQLGIMIPELLLGDSYGRYINMHENTKDFLRVYSITFHLPSNSALSRRYIIRLFT
jgi:hypothetical protein